MRAATNAGAAIHKLRVNKTLRRAVLIHKLFNRSNDLQEPLARDELSPIARRLAARGFFRVDR